MGFTRIWWEWDNRLSPDSESVVGQWTWGGSYSVLRVMIRKMEFTVLGNPWPGPLLFITPNIVTRMQRFSQNWKFSTL
jgi:hypothetical protein